MGIPVLQGRSFEEQDFTSPKLVALISSKSAKTLFPNLNPVGYHIGFQELTFQIGGVVSDVKYLARDDDPGVRLYLPYSRFSRLVLGLPQGLTFEIRMEHSELKAASSAIIEVLHQGAPTMLIVDLRTATEQIDSSTAQERFAALLASAVGITAMFLGVVGIGGTITLMALNRRREVAIRFACGASQEHIIGMFLADTVRSIGLGAICVLPLGWVLTKLLSHFLYGMPSSIGWIVVVACITNLVIAVGSALYPLCGATRITAAELPKAI